MCQTCSRIQYRFTVAHVSDNLREPALGDLTKRKRATGPVHGSWPMDSLPANWYARPYMAVFSISPHLI